MNLLSLHFAMKELYWWPWTRRRTLTVPVYLKWVILSFVLETNSPYHAGYGQTDESKFKYGPYLQQQQQQGHGQLIPGQGPYPLTQLVK